jgi:hypothetical protein
VIRVAFIVSGSTVVWRRVANCDSLPVVED